MAGGFGNPSEERARGFFTQVMRQGVALGLCATLLPFTQMDLLAQTASSPQQYGQQSQYPYQDPGEPSSNQAPSQPQQYGAEQPMQPQQQMDGNGPAGPPPAYQQPGYGQQSSVQGQYGQGEVPQGYGESGYGQGGYGGGATGAYTPQSPQQLEQLVAPIALYPDSLVAQVLAGSTYPQQVQEAEDWMRQNGGQAPEQLAQAVNAMPWDPSVKALTQFPSVLEQLARSSQWTIALGNAYYNQPADVMSAVQSMRYRAREAGQLRDTPQQVVVDQGPEIVIQPADPEVVYVPYYDPWAVYGEPVPVFYGFYRPPPPPGLFFGLGLGIGFGVGIGLAAWGHYGWGCHAWAPNWRSNTIIVNNNTYISHSTTVINRGNFGAYNQGFGRSGPQNFARAPFNPHEALYRGRTVSAMNRPSAGFGVNRPGQPGQFNRPVQAGQPGQFHGAGTTGIFNRPGQARPLPGQSAPFQRGTQQGQFHSPAQPGTFNRPAQSGQWNRPAPMGGTYNSTGGFHQPVQPYTFNRSAAGTGGFSRSPAVAYNHPPAFNQNFGRTAGDGFHGGYSGGSRPQIPSAPRANHGGGWGGGGHEAPRPQPQHMSGGGGNHGGGGFHGGGGGGNHGGGGHRR